MTLKTQMGTLAALVVVLSLSFGTLGFTLFEADRSANVEVVGDTDGVMSLNPGSTDVVQTDADGEMYLDFDEVGNGDPAALNVESTLEIGDDTDAQNEYAYSMETTLASGAEVTKGYDSDDNVDAERVNVAVYADDNTEVASFGADETADFTIGGEETVYVVITYDSIGMADGDDLSGDITLEAEQNL